MYSKKVGITEINKLMIIWRNSEPIFVFFIQEKYRFLRISWKKYLIQIPIFTIFESIEHSFFRKYTQSYQESEKVRNVNKICPPT